MEDDLGMRFSHHVMHQHQTSLDMLPRHHHHRPTSQPSDHITDSLHPAFSQWFVVMDQATPCPTFKSITISKTLRKKLQNFNNSNHGPRRTPLCLLCHPYAIFVSSSPSPSPHHLLSASSVSVPWSHYRHLPCIAQPHHWSHKWHHGRCSVWHWNARKFVQYCFKERRCIAPNRTVLPLDDPPSPTEIAHRYSAPSHQAFTATCCRNRFPKYTPRLLHVLPLLVQHHHEMMAEKRQGVVITGCTHGLHPRVELLAIFCSLLKAGVKTYQKCAVAPPSTPSWSSLLILPSLPRGW